MNRPISGLIASPSLTAAAVAQILSELRGVELVIDIPITISHLAEDAA